MKQQKPNKMVSRLTGLTLLLTLFLCIGLFAVSAGTTFARYRDEHQKDVVFQVREPERVLLGTVEKDVFTLADPLTNPLVWNEVNDVFELQFAVANGESETSYSTRDQAIQLCMFGSIGIQGEDESLPKLSVTFTPQRGNETEKTVEAEASRIVKGTALYHTYGDGWLYRFYETTPEGKRELTWELPGGRWSYITLTIESEGEISERLSLLQPLISAEPVG